MTRCRGGPRPGIPRRPPHPPEHGFMAGGERPAPSHQNFSAPGIRRWRSLRESEDANTSAWPCRASWRLPYGSRDLAVEDLISEDTDGADHKKYSWANAAYAMAPHHPCLQTLRLVLRIRGAESGGMVEGLPCHTFPTDDGAWTECPTESPSPTAAKPNSQKRFHAAFTLEETRTTRSLSARNRCTSPPPMISGTPRATANLGARLP